MLTFDGEHLAAAVNLDPHSPVAIKYDAVDQTVGSDGQVEAVPALAQIAQGGTEADAVVVVRDGWPDTRSVGAIVVRAFRKARSPTGVVEGPLGRMPLLSFGMVDKDRAIGSMVFVMEVNVGLDRPEVWEDLLETPLVVAASRPAIEIIRDAAVEGRSVDGTGPSRHLASGHWHWRRLGGGSGDELPVVWAAQQGDGMARRGPQGRRTCAGVKAKLELFREMFECG